MIHSITKDNAADIVKVFKGEELLCVHLYNLFFTDMPSPRENFHVRCLAHILYLAVKECMWLFHYKITKIWKLIGCHQSSVKRKVLFNGVKAELGLKIDLPSLDVEMCW